MKRRGGGGGRGILGGMMRRDSVRNRIKERPDLVEVVFLVKSELHDNLCKAFSLFQPSPLNSIPPHPLSVLTSSSVAPLEKTRSAGNLTGESDRQE